MGFDTIAKAILLNADELKELILVIVFELKTDFYGSKSEVCLCRLPPRK